MIRKPILVTLAVFALVAGITFFNRTPAHAAGSGVLDNLTSTSTRIQADVTPHSAGSTLTHDAPPKHCAGKPLKPTLTGPTNMATIASPTVVLDWDDMACATSYKVVVKLDTKEGITVDSKAGLEQSAFKTRSIASGQTYSWRVKACNSFGCRVSQRFYFTVR